MEPLVPEDMEADMMGGPDMMDIMKQTASQLNTKRPDLLPQATMNVTNHDNALIGTPLNYETSASPNPAVRIRHRVNFSDAITAGPTINLGGYKEETPMMFDENYDAKDDLTKEQQKDGLL